LRSRHVLFISLTVLTVILGAGAGLAQDVQPARAPWHSGNHWGVGAQFSYPYADFGDRFANGYGLQGLFDYPLIPLIDVCASVGWNRFPGAADGDGVNIWEVSFGGRFALGAFFMGSEMAYFSEVDQGSVVPSLGLRYDHWEVSVRFKAVGDNSWTGFRTGFYF